MGRAFNNSDAETFFRDSLRLALAPAISTHINASLPATFPKVKYSTKEHGQIKQTLLRLILTAVAGANPQVGFVPGLNYLAACLLHHTRPVLACWLLQQLIENYKLHEIYKAGQPGIAMHGQIIQMLIGAKNETLAHALVFFSSVY